MVMSKLVIDFYCFRKKYMRSCQIQHDYGEEDCNYNEDEALDLTSNAIRDGQAPPPPSLEYVERPEGASVNVGGKACKWCGSTTHTRRSHRDCIRQQNTSDRKKYARLTQRMPKMRLNKRRRPWSSDSEAFIL